MKAIAYLLLMIGVVTACTKDPDVVVRLSIKASIPPEAPHVDFATIPVKVQHVNEPIVHTAYFDEQGSAEMEIHPGNYTALVSALLPNGYTVSAGVDEFLLTGDGIIDADGKSGEAVLNLTLDYALSGGLIFREIYYGGSKTPQGANYSKDQYIELYNNSEEVIYLDSLCIGGVAPVNSTSSSNPWAGMDELALFQMTWMIPGTGKQYTLEPGKSCVIAMNAIDHSDRCTSGLDLSKSDFGFYDDALTHEKHPDVVPLQRIFSGLGTAYAISVSSPALVIFRPSMGVKAWIENAAYWQRYQPGQSSGMIYNHFHRSWIMDGVECVSSPSRALKRLPTAVDASYIYLRQGQNLGNAMRRKVKETTADGRVIYMDTNNSAEDFETDIPASPHFNK